jgi:hypothetical protein
LESHDRNLQDPYINYIEQKSWERSSCKWKEQSSFLSQGHRARAWRSCQESDSNDQWELWDLWAPLALMKLLCHFKVVYSFTVLFQGTHHIRRCNRCREYMPFPQRTHHLALAFFCLPNEDMVDISCNVCKWPVGRITELHMFSRVDELSAPQYRCWKPVPQYDGIWR